MMKRRAAAALWLLALTASHATALAGLLLAEQPPACCTGTLCPIHQERHPTPSNKDCDQHGGSSVNNPLGDCSVTSCNPPERQLVSAQPYVLPAPPETPQQATVASQNSQPALYFPSPTADKDSPPPRDQFA